jgi:predicted ArsR family transcriptional regulator
MDGPKPDFSLDDVRELLGFDEVSDDPKFLTVSEWAEKLHRSNTTIREKLKEAVEAGRFEAKTVMRVDEMGRTQYPTGYKPR